MGLAAQRFSSGNVSFGTPTAKASYFRPVEALRRATRRSDDARRVGKYISYVCARAPPIFCRVALLGSTQGLRARLQRLAAQAASAARRLLNVSGLHPRASDLRTANREHWP